MIAAPSESRTRHVNTLYATLYSGLSRLVEPRALFLSLLLERLAAGAEPRPSATFTIARSTIWYAVRRMKAATLARSFRYPTRLGRGQPCSRTPARPGSTAAARPAPPGGWCLRAPPPRIVQPEAALFRAADSEEQPSPPSAISRAAGRARRRAGAARAPASRAWRVDAHGVVDEQEGVVGGEDVEERAEGHQRRKIRLPRQRDLDRPPRGVYQLEEHQPELRPLGHVGVVRERRHLRRRRRHARGQLAQI